MDIYVYAAFFGGGGVSEGQWHTHTPGSGNDREAVLLLPIHNLSTAHPQATHTQTQWRAHAS